MKSMEFTYQFAEKLLKRVQRGSLEFFLIEDYDGMNAEYYWVVRKGAYAGYVIENSDGDKCHEKTPRAMINLIKEAFDEEEGLTLLY